MHWRLPAALLLTIAGCNDFIPTAPYPGNLIITVTSGDRQLVSPSSALDQPLQALVTHDGTGDAVPGVTVEWRLSSGLGAELVGPESLTDANGIARSGLRLGTGLGLYTVEVGVRGSPHQAARFTAFAVSPAVIGTVVPTTVMAGDTVLIQGSGFAPFVEDYAVLFDGVPSAVARVTPTGLYTVVPPCMPSRVTQVAIRLGNVVSQPAPLNVIGRPNSAVQLAPGQVTVTAGAAAGCISLGGQPGDSYLLVPFNASAHLGEDIAFQLAALAGSASTQSAPRIALSPSAQRRGSAQLRLENHLRSAEADLLHTRGTHPQSMPLPFGARVNPPRVGDIRNFNVFTWQGPAQRVRAVARAISTRAIIYEDLDAPDAGFSQNELNTITALFDDPIYSTDVAVYGSASDTDGNGRIIVLLTPAVNRLTLPGDSGYVAGFTFFCDLLSSTMCPDSNEGEILYSIVPDSLGVLGRRHARQDVLQRLPGVLAHELAHLIHFNQRMLVRNAQSLEDLWLAEALAHTAEDTIGRVLQARGQTQTADQTLRANRVRASLYLTNPSRISLPYGDGGDSLEGRGAGWLFLKYLTGRFGAGLLRDIMASTDHGASAITNRIHQSWENVVGDWFVALFADDAPELTTRSIDSRFTYPDVDLRAELSSISPGGAFPLHPASASGDFVTARSLPASAPAYVLLSLNAQGTAAVAFSAALGAAFAPASRARLVILRLK